MISRDIGLWIQALLILMYFSQLYKDNLLYRFSEYTLIGIAVGHGVLLSYQNVVSMVYIPLTVRGEYMLLIPIILGLLIWTRFIPKYSWISRIPMSLIMGLSTAIAVRGAIKTQIYEQIIASIRLAVIEPSALGTFNNIIIIITTICTLSYFLFLREQKGALGITARIGRLTMMAMYGNTFAWFYMSRVASLLAQMQLILLQLLGLG